MASRCLWLASSLLVACQATSNGSQTGGVNSDASTGCPAGVAAVLGDSYYASSQVALLGLDGTVKSASFVSTASTQADQLAFALSGDIALPMTPPASGRVVIIDRLGTDVITWLDPATAHVQAQLAVGTGFDSNPQDYLETAQNRALVSRWGVNDKTPGTQPFDSGNDLLLIDSQALSIQGQVQIPSQDNLPPRPAG